MLNNKPNNFNVFQLAKEIDKQILLLRKDKENHLANQRSNIKTIFEHIKTITNNKTLIKRRNHYINFLLSNFSSFLLEIIIHHKNLFLELSKEILHFLRNFLINEENFLNDSTFFQILSLYHTYILYSPLLDQNILSLHNDFFQQMENYKGIQCNIKMLFKILITIYRKYASTELINERLFTEIIYKLLSISKDSYDNKDSNETLLFYLSSLNNLCIHSYHIAHYFSKSETFYLLIGNILSSYKTNFHIKFTLLNLCSIVINDETKGEMCKIIYSSNFTVLKEKFIYYFPFLQNYTQEKMIIFQNSCFSILRLLVQNEITFPFFSDCLYTLSKNAVYINKYFEAIFFSFFYWSKKHIEHNNTDNYINVNLSFIQNQLFEFKTPLEEHDKTTTKEILDFLDMENKSDLLNLLDFLSVKQELIINNEQENFPLFLLTKILSLYPHNKFVVSVLNEIPYEFILNKHNNNENETFDKMIEGILIKTKSSLENVVNDIEKVEEDKNEYINLFCKNIEMFKICLILQPLSQSESFESKSKSSSNKVKSEQEFTIYTGKVINVIKNMFDNFINIFFTKNKFINYNKTCKKIFSFVGFIIQNSLSFVYGSLFNDGEMINQLLNHIISTINQGDINKQYEIIKCFFLELWAPIKIKYLQDKINIRLFESLLSLIDNVLQYSNIELELFIEIIRNLMIMNEHFKNNEVKELLISFYMHSSNFLNIMDIIINNKNFYYYQGDTFFHIINEFINFISDNFIRNIINYLQTQETELFIIKIVSLLENFIYNNHLLQINKRTFCLMVRLFKKIIDYSRTINFFNKKISLPNIINSTFCILEKLSPYDYTQKPDSFLNHNNRTIKNIFNITISLQDIYISDKHFNCQDKELLIINSNIISIFNNLFPQDLSILNEKLVEFIIQTIIPCKKIEDDDLPQINSIKSHLLLSLWSQQIYKDFLFKLISYFFNYGNIHALTISNTINVLLGNIGLMITNAKKQNQLFELTSMRNKWIVPSFFKNKIFYLVDSSVKTTILIMNIIKVLESKIAVVGIEQDENILINRASRLLQLKQRTEHLNSFSKICLKEDKTQISFIPHMISAFYKRISVEEEYFDESEGEKSKESFDTQTKISRKQKISLILSMENDFENLQDKGNIVYENLFSVPENLEIDEDKKLEKPKRLFLLISDNLIKMTKYKRKNLYQIELLNMDLTKIIYYPKFHKLIEKEDITKQILELLNLDTSICFIHTKVGILLTMKHFIKEILIQGISSSLMDSFFVNNFNQIVNSSRLDDNISKIKCDVITLYISHISNDITFIKNNISLFNLNSLLTLLKGKKYNIEIISNLLDIMQNTINYLISTNNIDVILNNSKEIKQVLLVELLSSYPVIMKIQQRILNIIKSIPDSEITTYFIQSIIDPFLSNVLIHLMTFSIDGTIADIDYFDSKSYDEVCSNLIIAIYYYCCQLKRKEYFNLLILSKEKSFFLQLLKFIEHFSTNITIIEKGFYILEKTIKEMENIRNQYPEKIQSLLFILLDKSIIDQNVSDIVVLQIISTIDYLFMHNKNIIPIFHSNISILQIFQTILDDFQENHEITFITLKVMKLIIDSYLSQNEKSSEEISSFIDNQLVKVIIKNKFITFISKVSIFRQISDIIQLILKNDKYSYLQDEILQYFLPETIIPIFKSDLPFELIDIFLSNIILLFNDYSFVIKYIEPFSQLIKEISQHDKCFNDVIYKHFHSCVSIIMNAFIICNDEDKKLFLEETFQDLSISIIIKYGDYLNKQNVCNAIEILEKEIEMKLINEISYAYINNIFAGLLNKNAENNITIQEELKLIKKLFKSLSNISKYLYDDELANIDELIDWIKEILSFLWDYFQTNQISQNDQSSITNSFTQSIMQIGLNNPLFISQYYNRQSIHEDELNISLNNFDNNIDNMIDNLYKNSNKHVIMVKKEKESLYEMLSQQKKFFYYDHKGNRKDVFLVFDMPKDVDNKGMLKLLKVHKKTNEVIKEYLDCPIQDIEQVEKGTRSDAFVHFEGKLFGGNKRNPDDCFVIHFSKHYEQLNNGNSISLEIGKITKENDRDIYINNIDKLIKSMKPLSVQL